MEQKICVYTCITGNYDDLKANNQEAGIDYLCFTNNPSLKSNTWKITMIENDGLDNIRLARKIKIMGHKYIDDNYDCSIWIDGATTIVGSIKDFIKNNCSGDNSQLCVFKHSTRNTVYDEAVACVYNRRADIDLVREEMNHLKSEGFKDDNGLIESTVFFKRHNDQLVKQTMQYWYETILAYTTRDQLAFNYAIYKSGIEVTWIDENVFFNEWFCWENHISKKSFQEARIYYGEFENLDQDNFEDIELDCKDEIYEINEIVKFDCDRLYIHLGQMPLAKFTLISNDVLANYSISYNCLNQIGDYLILDNEVLIMDIKADFRCNDVIKFKFKIEELTQNEILGVLRQVYYDKQYQKSLMEIIEEENQRKDRYIKSLEAQSNELRMIKESKGWEFLEKIRKIKDKITK